MEPPLPLSIFIVEDNEWYGELLLHQLGRNPDHRVQRFGTARECLAQMTKEIPDVITLDYSLPDADGAHTLSQLRERAPRRPSWSFRGRRTWPPPWPYCAWGPTTTW